MFWKRNTLEIHELWMAILVLGLGALLRIYQLDSQGLWGDEGWSVEFSDSANPATVTQRMVNDLHPPLYFLVLSVWRQVTGDSVFAMRLLAVFPALITIALLIRLGNELFSSGTGILAGLILAIADKHIVLSQEVRHYPMAFMWMALSSLVFIRWLKRPTRFLTLIYACLVIVSVYTHYYAALIFIVQSIYTLLTLRERFWKLVLLIMLSMIAFMPWSFVAWYQLLIRPEGILHSMPLNLSTAEFLTVDFLGRPVILLGSLLLISLGATLSSKRYYAALWFIVPIFITVVVYPLVTVLTDRNLALLLLPTALLVGYGMSLFRPRWILAILVTANGLTSLDSYFDHPPSRELAEYIAAHYPAGEPVLMDVVGEDKALDYHLREILPANTSIISLNQWRIDYGVYFLGVLNQLLEQNNGFWIAYWVNEDRLWDVRQPLADSGYVLTASHREYHLGFPIDLYHYDRDLNAIVALYDGQIRLHRVKFPAIVALEDPLIVSLWWSTTETLSDSYSVSVFLLDDSGRLQAQHDGPPQNGQAPTNTWEIDHVYFDSHQIPTNHLQRGTYHLAIKVYNSANGQILFVNSNEYSVVNTVEIR